MIETHVRDLPLVERVIGNILQEAADDSGDRTFLEFDDGAYTYAEVNRLAEAAGRGFLAQGVEAGDRIVLLLRNRPEFLEAWFGAAKIGATIVPINPEWVGDTLEYILLDADPRLVIVRPESLATAAASLPNLQNLLSLVVCGGVSESARPEGLEGVPQIAWEDVVIDDDEPLVPPTPVRHDTVLAILYSSGTTGRPKGIVMPHAHVYSFSRQWMRATALTEADTLYASTPLFYMLATILGVVPTLLVRSKIRIAPRFSASQYWDDIRACGATVAHSVFSVIPILLKQPPSPLDRQHNVRAMFIAKSNAEFEKRFGVRLIEIYGSTEMNIVAYNPWDAPKPGTCGKPAPNFEVKIVDDDDNELPQGEIGEIVSRPREPFTISYGYYKRPEITVESWRNLWFHCGDRGYFDEDGYLVYVDRKKDVIRRGGENISSYELERQVNSHPLVLESAAIPVPSELGEDEVKVCVVLQPGAEVDASELLEHVSELVPRFMVPRYLEFMDELPRTGSLKIEKYKLVQDGLNERTFDRKTAGYVVV